MTQVDTPDKPVVGVVGAETATEEAVVDQIRPVVAENGGSIEVNSVETVLETTPTAICAVGHTALSALAESAPDCPIVPVDAGAAVPSCTVQTVGQTLRAALEGTSTLARRPVLSVSTDGQYRGAGLFEITLVTDEPARISEYSLHRGGKKIAQFRADGVTVATPAGSHGYASDAGGPLLSAAVEAIVAVPIAPFVTHGRQWILPNDRLSITVERDETAVACQIDEEFVVYIQKGQTVHIETPNWLLLVHPST